jgi:hypothetical protein
MPSRSRRHLQFFIGPPDKARRAMSEIDAIQATVTRPENPKYPTAIQGSKEMSRRKFRKKPFCNGVSKNKGG